MKPSLPELIACPACAGRLASRPSKEEGDEVIEGELTCGACGLVYPVRRGVPRFTGTGAAAETSRTAEAFGWEWQAFPEIEARHEQQFLDWIAPARPETFRDKVVVEGGCGKGRHTRLVARYGARAIIGVDLSDAVDVAFANTRGEPNAHIVQADLRALPLRPGTCDLAFSVGVLHHMSEPFEGFQSLARAVTPGGTISIWVYGAENNRWISGFISPLRTALFSRLPPRALYAFSWLASIPLWIALRVLYRPAARGGLSWLRRWLFYYPYLGYISEFPFREIHNIVHDHLAAPVAHYVRRDEVERWYHRIGAGRVTVDWHNRNSWRGAGVVAGLPVGENAWSVGP